MLLLIFPNLRNPLKVFIITLEMIQKSFVSLIRNCLPSGLIFSHTEFRIIELIEQGLSTKEIAEKLFRSPFTINTHRTNIIKKAGKSSIAGVISDLKAKGLL